MKLTHQKHKGFTLVELLVVIAIIAVLAAIATPVTVRTIVKAKITKSKTVCTALAGAVDNFETEYNYLPFGEGEPPTQDNDAPIRSDDHLMAVLAGVEEDLNFKQIRFFETAEASGNKDGMVIDKSAQIATLYDPWGELYYIFMDYDLDGGVDHPFDEGATISGNSAVFSIGPDGKSGSLKTNRDNPTSF